MSKSRAAQAVVTSLALGVGLVSTLGSASAEALPTPTCAWSKAWTPFGLGNWLFADTGNRWWYMPIDPQWTAVTITGHYPKARFFSFAVYDDAPVSTGLADRLYDAQLAPDAGSLNPFRPGDHSPAGDNGYTVTVTRKGSTASNNLRLNSETGWLVYRLYLPNGGEGSTGGEPLPTVAVTGADGQSAVLPTCPVVNRQSELAGLTPQFVPPLLETPPAMPPVPDRIWFAPISKPPIRLLPNPDNKYLISYFMSAYETGRIVVVHGKMPSFPDTYRGEPAWKPASGSTGVQMRYWSMCVGALISPLPITGCSVDAETPLDENGFYTVVISNDVIRPGWLPQADAWIPWGDEQMSPRTIFLRNTLPASGFTHSAQEAVDKGCGVEFRFPVPPGQDEIRRSGKCASEVMADHYPVAVWCDREVFTRKGWAGCIDAARVD